MKDYLQTVTGPVAREDMGLTLPHEHLFNDLSSVVDAPCYPFSQRLVDKKVTAEIQWALKHDPYCCADNMDRKPIEDVIFEINNFISLGGPCCSVPVRFRGQCSVMVVWEDGEICREIPL